MLTGSSPTPIDDRFAALLCRRKAEVVIEVSGESAISQLGAARLDGGVRPPWPEFVEPVRPDRSVIETFVCHPDRVEPTGSDEATAAAWTPMAAFVNTRIRSALETFGVELCGDAFLTASRTPRGMHDGVPHVDDDLFEPDHGLGVVAILATLAGPTIAGAPLPHRTPRPGERLTFDPTAVAAFASETRPRTVCAADELILFPQFGQLHAGPSAGDLPRHADERQLLVFRSPTRPA